MKRLKSAIVLAIAIIVLAGCHSDIEGNLSNLERRINNLVDKVGNINVNIVQLQSLFNKLEQYDFVKNVKRDYSYDDPTYVITFTHSDPIILSCGTDAETPVIGVAYDTDGKAYWTVKYGNGTSDFLYNEYGLKVLVTAVTPLVRINDGKWEISYNEGEVWKPLGTDATGSTGTSFVSSVEESDGYIKIKLVSGDVISLPLQSTYDALIQDVQALNNNIKTTIELVQKMKDSYIYVKSTSPIINGSDTVGFRITMSDDTSYPFYHGKATNKPEVTALQDKANPADTAYYWAMKLVGETEYQWIFDEDSSRIRANAIVNQFPLFRIAEDDYLHNGIYYWQVSVDGGKTYNWLRGKDLVAIVASPAANDAGITSLTYSAGYYLLTVNRQTIKIPAIPIWEITFNGKVADSLVVSMTASDTAEVNYAISAIGSAPELAAYAQDGFKTWVEKSPLAAGLDPYNGKIKIISPASFTKDSTYVKVIVSDGAGKINNYSLKVKYTEGE